MGRDLKRIPRSRSSTSFVVVVPLPDANTRLL